MERQKLVIVPLLYCYTAAFTNGNSFPVEQLSLALEDEREQVKAVKKKNLNIVKDLQRQLQSSNRYVKEIEVLFPLSC